MSCGENCVNFLKERITKDMSLNQIVEAFEKMCQIPIENEMILFETGIFSFSGEPFFYFSLVRQYPNEDEEFYQIHLEVRYQPNKEYEKFNELTWDEDINQNIFEYIRNSNIYQAIMDKAFVGIDIFLDEM